ncbi:hypothetical protein EV421DRAFT_1738048 [Armillaria borealis]|uniref:Heterokaryon incompatibility domain-containing protein n=1 Tax=Armillaria borealis TaxID=47425 RepID=A0AA39JAH8_9AGAR|nr:hypothetical protein EV421DRAFT_1738048 [Armillaria borealis]
MSLVFRDCSIRWRRERSWVEKWLARKPSPVGWPSPFVVEGAVAIEGQTSIFTDTWAYVQGAIIKHRTGQSTGGFGPAHTAYTQPTREARKIRMILAPRCNNTLNQYLGPHQFDIISNGSPPLWASWLSKICEGTGEGTVVHKQWPPCGQCRLESDPEFIERRKRDIAFASLPEVTISAQTETGQAESSVIVPLQRKHTSKEPVISSSLADTPCGTLGILGFLEQLNATLGTSYTLQSEVLTDLLEHCIAKDYNFGTAYAFLRPIWFKDWDTIQAELVRREEQERDERQKALIGTQIVNPHIPPRRVWDLYSNRVVPWWWIVWANHEQQSPLIPMSHAWMDEADCVKASTNINGFEWPVPIPKETNLNLIRIEMLNLGAEYAWLDVLCLRQRGGQSEDLHAEEWRLDGPTIGSVYDGRRVACYLNGLGRPLRLKTGYFDNERCWFKRAWTLQEVGRTRIIAGDTPGGPLHAKPIDEYGNYETGILTRFHKQLGSLDHVSLRTFVALAEMQNRVSVYPADKIAGLAHILKSKEIPAYYEIQVLEDAWTALVNRMHPRFRAHVFFLYPRPGDTCKQWRLSLNQVTTTPLPVDCDCVAEVYRDEVADDDWCEVRCIEQGFVRGLGGKDVNRRGELMVKGLDGTKHVFNVIATHQCPIPEGTYTLLGSDRYYGAQSQRWVVGRRLPEHRFKKISVFAITDLVEVDRLMQLGVDEETSILNSVQMKRQQSYGGRTRVTSVLAKGDRILSEHRTVLTSARRKVSALDHRDGDAENEGRDEESRRRRDGAHQEENLLRVLGCLEVVLVVAGLHAVVSLYRGYGFLLCTRSRKGPQETTWPSSSKVINMFSGLEDLMLDIPCIFSHGKGWLSSGNTQIVSISAPNRRPAVHVSRYPILSCVLALTPNPPDKCVILV